MKSVIISGYEFKECKAVAIEAGDADAQNALFCHKLDDEFCDGDCVIFGYELPESVEDVETIMNDFSAHETDCETLNTVTF